MVAKVVTSALTLLSVCASLPATHDQAGYEALTFTEVGEVTDIGDFGPEFAEVTHIPLKTAVVQKFKGSLNYGSVALTLGRDADDAGQAILKGEDGLFSQDPIAFKVEFQDGSVQYFDARVMSFTTNTGGADQIVGSTVNVGISTSIVEVIA